MQNIVPKYSLYFSILIFALLVFMFINLSTGSVHISLTEIFDTLFISKNTEHEYLILNYRLPKTITSLLVGAGLGVSGLLMQTYFRNPLAGPFVLGISSGASLGVALLIMGGSFIPFWVFISSFSIPMAACIGSFAVMILIFIATKKLSGTSSILIIGLMVGSFANAFISLLSFLSPVKSLQQYVFWNLGSLGNLSWNELSILSIISFIACIILLPLSKKLDMLLLGENYAVSMGLSVKKNQFTVFLVTSLLTGSITAFVGPIAFIGVAIPHITRLVFTTSKHKILIPAVAIMGSTIMLICSCLTDLPFIAKTIPINIITSIIGAPIVIWLILRSQKMYQY